MGRVSAENVTSDGAAGDAAQAAGGAAQLARGKREGWIVAVLCVLVAALTAGTHWPVLTAQALSFDDNEFLTENKLVRNPGWESARRFATEVLEPSTVEGYYLPLTMISLMVDYALGGRSEDLRQFHRTNLALHVLNTVLLVVLLYGLFGQPVAAGLAGLLFGVHPLTVEPVAWIGERKTLLAMFFALLCLLVYVRYARRGGWGWLSVAAGLYVLAVLAKPTAVPLPVVLLALDFWPLRRLVRGDAEALAGKPPVAPGSTGRQAASGTRPPVAPGTGSKLSAAPGLTDRRSIPQAVEKAPFFVLAAAFAVLTVVSHGRTSGYLGEAEAGAVRGPLLSAYLVAFYLGKIIWPANLCSVYALPEPLELTNAAVLVALGVTVVVVAVTLVALRWTRAPLAALVIFIAALSPTLGVLRYSWVAASDKYVYLPAIGVVLIVAWALGRVWRAGRRWRGWHIVAVALVLSVAAAEARGARMYLPRWRDTVGLYKFMLSRAPGTAKVHNNLGAILLQRGQLDEARQQFECAVELDPRDPDPRNNLGSALAMMGRTREAIPQFEAALAGEPSARVHENLGTALAVIGRAAEARGHFETALKLEPDRPASLAGLAWVLLLAPEPGQRDPQRAVQLAERAAAITQRRNATALNALAAAYAAVGRRAECVQAAEEAVRVGEATLAPAQVESLRRQLESYRK